MECYAIDSRDWQKDTITEQQFKELLTAKINEVNMDDVKTDISRGIKNSKVLDIGSSAYFHDLVIHLKLK